MLTVSKSAWIDVFLCLALFDRNIGLMVPKTGLYTPLQSFTNPPPLAGGAVGKDGLEEYRSRGYLSSDNPQGSDQVASYFDIAAAVVVVLRNVGIQMLSSYYLLLVASYLLLLFLCTNSLR